MARITKKYLGSDSVDATKVRFDNNTAFRARDAADSSDIEVFKVDSSDVFQFLVHPQIITSASGDNDVLTLKDLNQELEGLKPKAAVRAATTASISLSGTQTVDGVSVEAGDRVLVKDQSAASENGIYDVGAGPWVRSSDMDELAPVDEVNGAYTFVQEGTENAGKGFVQTGSVSDIGVDDLVFIFFNSSSNLVGGDGIDYSGSTISVDLTADPYLEFDSGALQAKVSPDLMATTSSGELADALQVKEAIDSAGRTSSREAFTLDATAIANGVTLANTPIPNSIDVQPVGGPVQQFGVDYVISTNLITFSGDLASVLEDGDVIYVKYVY